MIFFDEISNNPTAVMPVLKRRFPNLELAHLERSGGNVELLAAELAAAHDLTSNEAAEQLLDTLALAPDLMRLATAA